MSAPTLLSRFVFVASLSTTPFIAQSCSNNNVGEQAGQACESPTQCYPNVDQNQLAGSVVCLGTVEGGYCTHTCTNDSDCCKIPGECETGFPQVCSPFETMKEMQFCFLACESDDVGEENPDFFCQNHAHLDFSCRSSGGGSANRKVCVP